MKKVVSLVLSMLLVMTTLAIPVAMAVQESANNELYNPAGMLPNNHFGGMSTKKTGVNYSEIQQVIKPKLVSFNDIKEGDVIATGTRNSPNEPCQVSYGVTQEFGTEEKVM